MNDDEYDQNTDEPQTSTKPRRLPRENIDSKTDELKDNKNYRKAVEALLHILTITRPVIFVSVNILGRRNKMLREADWFGVEKVIGY